MNAYDIPEKFDDGSVDKDLVIGRSSYHPIINEFEDFRYGMLYGNFDNDRKYLDGNPLLAQRIFDFAYDRNIPISLGMTNPYGGCGLCNDYRSKTSYPFLDRRIKSPYMFLLLIDEMDKNAQYIDEKTKHNTTASCSHVYYWHRPDGRIISVWANIDTSGPFVDSYLYKSTEDMAYQLKRYFFELGYVTGANTYTFTDKWFQECAEYYLEGLDVDEKGIYRNIYKHGYKFVDFLFKDYQREVKYENKYVFPYVREDYDIGMFSTCRQKSSSVKIDTDVQVDMDFYMKEDLSQFQENDKKTMDKFAGYRKTQFPYYYTGWFNDLLALSNRNGRPLLVIYGKCNNTGTNAFSNSIMNRSSGKYLQMLNKYTACVENTQGLYGGGFYIVYYIDDGTTEQANEVKRFIQQYEPTYGKIECGYPWYISVGWKNGECSDENRIVRYGGIYTDGTQQKETSEDDEICSNFETLLETLARLYDYNYAKQDFSKHTVTFCDYDGTIIKTQVVLDGKSADKPEDPTREGYVFTGWSPDFSSVVSDMRITAQYAINGNFGYDKTKNVVIKIGDFGRDSTLHRYQDKNVHVMRISGNVEKINIYSLSAME